MQRAVASTPTLALYNRQRGCAKKQQGGPQRPQGDLPADSCWLRHRRSPRPTLASVHSHLTAAQRGGAGAAYGSGYPLYPHRGG
jgi:hypothetical protein